MSVEERSRHTQELARRNRRAACGRVNVGGCRKEEGNLFDDLGTISRRKMRGPKRPTIVNDAPSRSRAFHPRELLIVRTIDAPGANLACLFVLPVSNRVGGFRLDVSVLTSIREGAGWAKVRDGRSRAKNSRIPWMKRTLPCETEREFAV